MSQIEIADLRLERSQKILAIEKALARTYIKISKEIQNSRDYPHNYSRLFDRFNPLVYDNTRAALSVISQISTRYVNEKTKTNPYPTQADIDLIKQQTDKAVESFWRKIRLATINENAPLESYVQMAATQAATSTLARTTQSKILQIRQTQKLMGGASIYSTEEDWSPTLEDSTVGIRQPKLRWTADKDERTCLLCQGLDGQSWYVGDDTIPIPGEQGPNGTHVNCRCVVSLIMPDDPTYSQ